MPLRIAKDFPKRLYRRLEWISPPLASLGRCVWRGEFELLPPRRTFALGPLHRAILRHIPEKGGVFVEFGANDGLRQSNTAYLEKYKGWTGLLIEALPTNIIQCARNRPRSVVIHAAVVPPECPDSYVSIRYADLMSILDHPSLVGECSVSEHVEMSGVDPRLTGLSFLSPARTLSSILAETNMERIDFMSVDIEGSPKTSVAVGA